MRAVAAAYRRNPPYSERIHRNTSSLSTSRSSCPLFLIDVVSFLPLPKIFLNLSQCQILMTSSLSYPGATSSSSLCPADHQRQNQARFRRRATPVAILFIRFPSHAFVWADRSICTLLTVGGRVIRRDSLEIHESKGYSWRGREDRAFFAPQFMFVVVLYHSLLSLSLGNLSHHFQKEWLKRNTQKAGERWQTILSTPFSFLKESLEKNYVPSLNTSPSRPFGSDPLSAIEGEVKRPENPLRSAAGDAPVQSLPSTPAQQVPSSLSITEYVVLVTYLILTVSGPVSRESTIPQLTQRDKEAYEGQSFVLGSVPEAPLPV